MLATDFLPVWYLVLMAFGFGVIIGSFLNVYIYRFHTGKSLSGSSHCLSCQRTLKWYDLFPLLSYLVLRGRCRSCSAYIPGRYFWVELTTGLLFVAVVLVQPIWWLWPWYVLLVSILVVVAVYDLYHLVIPQEFVYALLGLAAVLLAYQWWVLPSFYMLGMSLLGGVLSYVFFWGLWKYSQGRWIGYGDAKLAVPLGVMVGLLGAFSMLVLSFWIGTIISLALMGLYSLRAHKRGQMSLPIIGKTLTMKSEVPFAPFLILGFLAVFLGGVDVLNLVSYALL